MPEKVKDIASLILAAGRGSRMKAYEGSKTLLPLDPQTSPYQGNNPILLEILGNLPTGPKAVVINHRKEDIIYATQGLGLSYLEQPVLNGTGGALLAAREFLEGSQFSHLIITMGDVPLVRRSTYMGMVENLKQKSLSVLGFIPEDKKQYGVLEVDGSRVLKITEWKYWKDYPKSRQQELRVCNSGIYAVNRDILLHYLPILASRPHKVHKKINGVMSEVKEFFITDLVEYMCEDGLSVGYIIGEEDEVMGVDDLSALKKAQGLFLKQRR